MLAISPDRHTQAWTQWGARCEKPAAIALISAHWVTRGVLVSAAQHPATIHDFYGFPKPLYELHYPAAGAPEWAEKVCNALKDWHAKLDASRGLDHGAWAPMRYLFPNADVPVFQVSLHAQMPHAQRYAIGQALGKLRSEGLMILGSGNVVHNLGVLHRDSSAHPFAWAQAFETEFVRCLQAREFAPLIEGADQLPHWDLAHPHPDHYWPVQVALGALAPHETARIITSGIELGSISMLTWDSIAT